MTHPLLSLRTSAPSLPSFSDNPPSLQVGLDTLTSSFHPIFSSCSYSPSSSFTKALYFHIPLSSVSCLWDLICRTSSAAIAALTAQICLSAQGLSPSVQRCQTETFLYQWEAASSHWMELNQGSFFPLSLPPPYLSPWTSATSSSTCVEFFTLNSLQFEGIAGPCRVFQFLATCTADSSLKTPFCILLFINEYFSLDLRGISGLLPIDTILFLKVISIPSCSASLPFFHFTEIKAICLSQQVSHGLFPSSSYSRSVQHHPQQLTSGQ